MWCGLVFRSGVKFVVVRFASIHQLRRVTKPKERSTHHLVSPLWRFRSSYLFLFTVAIVVLRTGISYRVANVIKGRRSQRRIQTAAEVQFLSQARKARPQTYHQAHRPQKAKFFSAQPSISSGDHWLPSAQLRYQNQSHVDRLYIGVPLGASASIARRRVQREAKAIRNSAPVISPRRIQCSTIASSPQVALSRLLHFTLEIQCLAALCFRKCQSV